MKVCSKCNKRKHLNKFPKRPSAKDGHNTQCLVCYNAQKAAWRAKNYERDRDNKRGYRTKNPDRIRDTNLKQKYGISLAEYNDILEQQGGVCAICSKPERMRHGKSGKLAPLAVDHCHATGKVRGLLCFSCNVALGKFGDDKNILKKALDYLLTM